MTAFNKWFIAISAAIMVFASANAAYADRSHGKREHRNHHSQHGHQRHRYHDRHYNNRHHNKRRHYRKHRHHDSGKYFLGGLVLSSLGHHYSSHHNHHDRHVIVYRSNRYGECFRVEHRHDRTVHVKVPHYKCR